MFIFFVILIGLFTAAMIRLEIASRYCQKMLNIVSKKADVWIDKKVKEHNYKNMFGWEKHYDLLRTKYDYNSMVYCRSMKKRFEEFKEEIERI